MAKVFVDTNCLIGLAGRAPETSSEQLAGHEGYISILSCHILFYVNKIKVPDLETNSFIEDFNILDLNGKILEKALTGPTNDLEDNIQLHSAAKSKCDFFITNDEELLNMKFFGETQIVSPQNLKN